MLNRNIAHLKEIIGYCQDIEKVHKVHGRDYRKFEKDIEYQYSISFCLEQIGEQAKKLRDGGISEKYPLASWNEIAGMRNRIAHEYGQVDLELVFDISVTEISTLMETCEEILHLENERQEKTETVKDEPEME